MMITFTQLAQELGLASANIVRKRAVRAGLIISSIRLPGKNRQLAVTPDVAATIRSWYEELMPIKSTSARRQAALQNPESLSANYIYVLQTTPDTRAERIKVGISWSASARCEDFKTCCPTLVLLRTYPGLPSHEVVVHQFLLRKGCTRIGEEVFDVPNLKQALDDIDQFFSFLGIEPSFKS